MQYVKKFGKGGRGRFKDGLTIYREISEVISDCIAVRFKFAYQAFKLSVQFSAIWLRLRLASIFDIVSILWSICFLNN